MDTGSGAGGSAAQLAAGTVFAGYRIIRRLGSGGMGEVYLAQHPRLPRQDALKILSAALTGNAEFRQRFRREADLAAELFHPNIVGVHDRGEFDGRLWIAMNYVDGTDAAQLVRETFAAGMPATEVAAVITAIAEALDYAHQRGLLHRDVKPANILLADLDGDFPRILLADFGIVRPLGDVSGLTATNFTVGTLSYAAPEQLMGAELDGRADQYALAATAFQLLTGGPPHQHDSPVAVISAHLNAAPPRVGDSRPELAGLDEVLVRALAKNPADRFGSCREFARALTDRIGAAPPSAAPVTIAHPAPASRPPRRRRWLLRAAAVTAGVVGGVGLLSDRGDSGDDTVPAAEVLTTTVTVHHDRPPGCDSQTWPQPVPDLAGKPLGVIRSEALKCFSVAAATAPDGRNVLDDPIGAARAWTIAAVSPPAGSHVGEHQSITLAVVPLATPNEPAAAVPSESVEPTPSVAPAPSEPPASTPSVAPPAFAPSTAEAPAGASAQCVDGTYSFSKRRSGTCSNHGGVARWLALG